VRRVLPIAIALFLFSGFAESQSQRAGKSSLEGIVLRSGTDAPLSNATVRIIPMRASIPSNSEVPSVTTDARGRFLFADLDPDDYRLEFALNGYVAQEYGQRVFPGQGTPMKLSPDQSLNNLVVRLTPTGAVSGRLLGSDSQPLGNVPVQLMRQQYVFRGINFEKNLEPVQDTRTNDRGEYRLFFVTPGRYLLTAGQPPNGRGLEEFNSPAGSRFHENVAFTYYPGVVDGGAARLLNVRTGEELSGIDMIVNAPRTYSIRGRVLDARTGGPPAAVTLALVKDGRQSGPAATYTAATGAFQFRDVQEGHYSAVAAIRPPEVFTGVEMPTPAADAAGHAPVTVAGTDVDGLVITLRGGVPLSGRVRIEGTASIDLAQLRAWLLPTPDSIPATTSSMRLLPESRVDSNGSFQFNHVWDGSYRFQLLLLDEGWFVKQARFGDQDVLKNPLQVPAPSANILEILISSNSAEVRANAVDASQRTVPGARVVLVPEQRDRTELFYFESADSAGLATLKGVVPGEYTLIAWEALEENAWFDGDIIEAARQSGKKLLISEGGRINVTVGAIPAP
jgi:hypothetical protein